MIKINRISCFKLGNNYIDKFSAILTQFLKYQYHQNISLRQQRANKRQNAEIIKDLMLLSQLIIEERLLEEVPVVEEHESIEDKYKKLLNDHENILFLIKYTINK